MTSSVVPIVIFGAGGHARVVADVLRSIDPAIRIDGFLDDREGLSGKSVNGLPILGSLESWAGTGGATDRRIVVAIGDNADRERVAGDLRSAGFKFFTAKHSTAVTGYGVVIGEGAVLMANTVVNADAVIGAHVIINTGATIDHDCVIGDFVHVSPGAHLAGNVRVGRGVHIGTGASAIPGVRIGDGAIVGAGATIIDDVPAGTTVVGTPAMPVTEKRSSSR